MDKLVVITLILVVFILCSLFYYFVQDITRKKNSDKAFKKSIQKQVVEIESKKNKIRVLGGEFEQTEFGDKKHAKK